MWFQIFQAVILVASTVYQNKKQKQLKARQAEAEEKRKGFTFTTSGEAVPVPILYGKNLIGGIAVKHHITSTYTSAAITGTDNFNQGFTNTTASGTKNEFLHVQYALCQDGVEGTVGVKVNNLDYNDAEQRFNHLIRTYVNGGTADPIATANGILSTNQFTGTSYASATFKLDRDDPQYNGSPEMSFLMKGRKVREVVSSPYSLGAYIYSNNPALCLLDYLLNADFGRGLSEDEVDLKSFYEAALVCGTIVSTGRAVSGVINGGPTTRDIPLYECNITLSPEDKIRDNIEAILNTMALAELTWNSEGKYKLLVEYPTSLVEQDALVDNNHYFTDDDIISSKVDISWPSASERLNQVTISFFNEHEDFKSDSVTWPKSFSTAHTEYLTEDNNQPFIGNFNLDGTTDPYHAAATAEQLVREARSSRLVSFTVSKRALSIEPGDFINITSATSNISDEVYRVQAIEVNSDFTVKLTCNYFDYTTLAWNVDDDIAYSTRPVYDFTVEPVTNLTYTAGTPDLDHTAIATLSWTAPIDGSFKSVVYYTDDAGKLKVLGDTSTTSFFVRPRAEWTNGQPVTFTVKAQTTLGRLSKGVSISNDVNWSPAPTSLSAEGTLGFINITWVNPADLDLNFVEVWESTDSNIGNATQIAKAFGDHYSRGNLFPLTTRYYWVRAVDFSGNRSDFTGPEFATTSQVTAGDIGPAVIGYDNFATDVTTVFDGISTDLSERALVADYNITVDYQQQLEHATNQLAEDALTLALNASSLESRINDAGITVDPATGSVTIQGLSAVEGQVNDVRIDLDAVEGELILKATTSYVNNAIAAATLPEATLAELEDLEAEVTTVKIDLDAVEGSITLTSTGSYYNVNDGVLGVEALEGRITINEDQITLKASQTEVTNVNTRLGTAETTLSTIDVPTITLAVQDVRRTFNAQEDLSNLTLKEILDRYNDRKYVTQDIAYARMSFTADLSDQTQAIASVKTELAAQIDANEATIFSEQTVRADAVSALAEDITQLDAQINDPLTGLPAAQASITSLDQTKVTADEATAIAQSEISSSLASAEAGTIGASIINLEQTKVTPTEATAIAQSEITSSLESAEFGSIGATITDSVATKVTAAEAVAAVNTEIGAAFNGISGLVTTATEVVADINGVEAKYGVNIDNNGNASGFQLLSGVGGSAFNVRADQFAVFNSTGAGGDNPFTIFTSPRTIGGVVYPAGTYIKNAIIDEAAIVNGSITNAKITDLAVTEGKIGNLSVTEGKIGNLSVDTIKIKNGAITNKFATFYGGNVSLSGTYVRVNNIDIDCDGNPVSVLFNCAVDNLAQARLEVRLDEVPVREFDISGGNYDKLRDFGSFYALETVFYETSQTVAMVITPTAGTKNVSVYAKVVGSRNTSPLIASRFLETTELKR